MSELPLEPRNQRFEIDLGGTSYVLRIFWCSSPEGGWTLDMTALDGTPLIRGLALTAGIDVLEQLDYLGVPGGLIVAVDDDPLREPTYESLGASGRIIFRPR